MITKAGKKLTDLIIEKANENRTHATIYAVMYAQSDDPKAKAEFEKYSQIEKTYRDMHGVVCQYLHAVEKKCKTCVQQIIIHRMRIMDDDNLPDSCRNELNCHESMMCKRCYSLPRRIK